MFSYSTSQADTVGRNCASLEVSAPGIIFSTSNQDDIGSGNYFPGCRAPWRGTPARALWGSVLLALFVFVAGAHGQLPPLQAPPSWEQVPQGTGACSVEKSCADLAPGMIRDALGPSPLEQNIRALEQILASNRNAQAAAWVAAALQGARTDQVHIEKLGQADSQQVVVGDVRGRQYPQDSVLLIAPFRDSAADELEAAEDAAVLIDAVRVIQATGNIPRRSIHFVFFTGAEHGSDRKLAVLWAYVGRHSKTLDHVDAAVSIDAASGPLNGYSLEGRPEMLPLVREALEPLRRLGIRDFSEDVHIEGDTAPFWLEGIPTLFATSDGGNMTTGDWPLRTTARPSLDAARLQQLKRGVAIAAVTAYALADAEVRIGPRRSPAEVQHSIDALGLEPRLRTAGLWSQWKVILSKPTR